jgi:hypothetical protein
MHLTCEFGHWALQALTGRTSDELNSTGGLYGHIPILRSNLLIILDAIGVTTGSPGNAWDRIPEFSKFLINLDTLRFSLSLFRRGWVTRIGFVLGEGRDALWVDGVTWVSTSDIPTIFQSLELVIKQGKRCLLSMKKYAKQRSGGQLRGCESMG